MNISTFVYPSVDGLLELFPLFGIMNNAVTNMVYKLLYECMFLFLLGRYLGVELLGHIITLFKFLRNG